MFTKKIFIFLIPLLLLPSASFAGKDVMIVTGTKAHSDIYPEEVEEKNVQLKKMFLGEVFIFYSDGKLMTLSSKLGSDLTCKEIYSTFSEADYDCESNKRESQRLYVKKSFGFTQSAVLTIVDFDEGEFEIIFEKK